jgi:hypothetical protein
MKDYVRDCITAALRQLPERMDTPSARLLIIAAGFQESDFQHRRQMGGPARGFWQFEEIGCRGVLMHHTTQDVARGLMLSARYAPHSDEAYGAIEHNDVLAAAFARLCFWRLPEPLPHTTDRDGLWHYYRVAWAPGRPRPEKWAESYRKALEWV